MAVLDAVILAGAPNKGRLREISDKPYEALIELHGKPLILYAVEAFQAAETVDHIVVVGPPAELEAVLSGADVEIIASREGMLENALAGCARLAEKRGGKRGLVVISSSDGPLVTPDIIDDLVRTCLATGGEIFYPVIERSVMEARFPLTRRTYAKLKDGTFTGGNLAVVDATALEREAETARALIRARKNPVKMAQTLGLVFIFKLLLGRLTVSELENHVHRTFNVKARAVFSPHAEIGIDIDKPEDFALVSDCLGER